ncbi:TPA: hypothetical protein N0F65_009556 [Lagenidium giganteum]|uniref:Multidrug and toxic compound extrusion protein n=1 Tax=Lagenidium giganteum TaxID=4803 RepID=A0AAV2YMA7_9STRA|nr:TPA: hypothetical protein N0F65_009556 [Lagenidium giganteum]
MDEARALWSMAWKVSLTTFCRIYLNTISTSFLGYLGSQELAAGALAGIWMNAVQMLTFGFAISLCTLCGQAYGARNYELVGIWLQIGVISLVVLSIPVMISFLYVDRILSFVTSDQEVLALANVYARWSIPMVLPQALYSALRQYFQAQEIVTPATIIGVLSVGVSFLANAVLIYGVGPFAGLGFIGSPIATCVASWFQPLALAGYACWYKGYHRKTWFGWNLRECLQWHRIRHFTTLACAMTLYLGLDEWVYNAISSIAGVLGALSLAGNSVLLNLWGLVFGIYWGFGLPTQVRTANFLGANRPQHAKHTLRVGFVLGGLSSAASALALLVLRHGIIQFFTPAPAVGAIIDAALPTFCVAVFLSGLHMMLAAVMEAMQLSTMLVLITALGSWGIMLPISFVVGIKWGYGLDGLWLGSICGEIVKFVLMAVVLARLDWQKVASQAVENSESSSSEHQVLMDEVDVEMQMAAADCSTPTGIGGGLGSTWISSVLTSPRAQHHVHEHHIDRNVGDVEHGRSLLTSTATNLRDYGTHRP